MTDQRIVYVDMDDVLCQYTAAHSHALQQNPNNPWPQSVPGFFESLEPVHGAVDAIDQLRSLFTVYVLSAPSTRNPLSYAEKRKWIEAHFDYDFTERLILASNKGLLKGDYLVDDHVIGKGQETFEGQLIHFGSPEYPDWQAVIQFFARLL